VPLEPHKGPKNEPDVVPKGLPHPRLTAIQRCVLLQAMVVLLDPPGPLRNTQPCRLLHTYVDGDPLLRGDDPEHLHQPKPSQMNHRARDRDDKLRDGFVPRPNWVHLPVAQNLGQEHPAVFSHGLEVVDPPEYQ
jgi:hypothetical protein